MAEPSIRIDKWLWHARVVRTRTLARKLIEAGKIRINREKTTSPSRNVRPGDVLTITLQRHVLVYEVVAIGNRRESFALASQLYLDRTAPGEAKTAGREDRDVQAAKRPDSRQRRQLARLRGKPV